MIEGQERASHSFLLSNGGIPSGQNSTWIQGNTSAFGWEPEEGLIIKEVQARTNISPSDGDEHRSVT